MSRVGLSLFVVLGGCGGWGIAGSEATSVSAWYDTGALDRPLPDVQRAVRDLLARDGYRVAPADPEALEWETEWDVHLSPRWREGYRTKVEVEFVPFPERSLHVRVRSFLEINDEARWPQLADRAQWVSASANEKVQGDVSLPALKILQKLRFKFQGWAP